MNIKGIFQRKVKTVDIGSLLQEKRYRTINTLIRENKTTLEEVVNVFYHTIFSPEKGQYFTDEFRTELSKLELSEFLTKISFDFNEMADIAIKMNCPVFSETLCKCLRQNKVNNIPIDKIVLLLNSFVSDRTDKDPHYGMDVSILFTFLFEMYVNEANLNDAMKSIIETKNARLITCFENFAKRKNVEPSVFVQLTDAIIEIKNAQWMFRFANYISDTKYINEIPMDRLAQALIKTKNAYYIYMFVKDIPGAPIDDLVQAIIDLGDFRYMCFLVKDINLVKEKGVNAYSIFKAIIKALGIESLSVEQIENTLKKMAEAEIFDIKVLEEFLLYWRQLRVMGESIFPGSTELGETSINGRQFVIE